MVTLIDLYDPAGTESPVATAEVSDCSLVNSRVAPEKTETWLPVVGVRVIPEMGKRKLRTVTPVGGVSESVRFSVPLLPPQFVTHRLCVPLQEESDRIAAKIAKTTYLLDFIQTPHVGLGRHLWRRCAAGFPQQHFNPVHCPGRAEN